MHNRIRTVTGRRTFLGALLLILNGLCFGAANAAITLVQHAGKDAGSTTTSTLAFPAGNTAHNWIAVAVRAGSHVGHVLSVTDTRGNLYVRAVQRDLTLDTVTMALFYAEDVGAGSNTVTITDTTAAGTLRFAIFEYAGVATTSSLDGSPAAAEGNSATLASPSIPGTSGDLILGVLSTADSATFTAGSGFTIEERVPVAPNTKLAVEDLKLAATGATAATATIAASQAWAAVVAAFRAAPAGSPTPDLTIAKTHSGSFTQGQTGATYTLTASNSGTGPTAGTVTVTDALPASLTATAIAGTGWGCTLAPLSCTRNDALGAGLGYPAITLTVNVSASAPASVTNSATIAGGGETATANDSANDLTTIAPTGGSAAITLVQHASKDAGTTASTTLAFPSDNALHNWIGVAIRAGSHTGHVLSVTDTRGNHYLKAIQRDETLDSVTLALFYAENVGAGPNTVTVSDSTAAGTLRFAVLEYSGVALSGSLDGLPAMAEGNSAAAASPTTSATSFDLVLGVLSNSDGTTFTAGSGFTIQERVPAAPNTKLAVEDQKLAATGAVSATATLSSSQAWGSAVAAFRAAGGGGPVAPDLTILKTHVGSFTQGQTGATYTLTASNAGSGPTVGTVTVADTLPASLTPTAFAGTGWSCTLAPLSCTRSDALASGGVYPAITLTVNVSATAPSSVINSATVAGGGETATGNDSANDPTTIASTSASAVGSWSAVQNWPVVAVHAHLLPTGDVLAWSDYTTTGGATIWRPSNNTFTPTTFAAVNLFCSGHTYLADGRLFVTGGIVGTQDDLGPTQSEIFNPQTGSWTAAGLMSQGRYYPTMTTLSDGRILVQGGTTTCNGCYADLPEIYDPATNVWTPLGNSARKAFKYYPHTYVLPDGRILVAAEDDATVVTSTLDLNTQTWTTIDASLADGHSSVMYRPGKIMKAGKATADDPGHPALATTYVLDMTQPSPAWLATSWMAFPRSYLNLTVLPDGTVLATGGGTTTDKATFATAVYEAELWTPSGSGGSWTTMSRSQTPRLYHSTALLLPDGRVLVAGGGRQSCTHPCTVPSSGDESNAEIFSPPYLFKGTRPVLSSAPGVLQYGTAFTVTTPDAARIASVSLIPNGSVTHAFNENQRFVPLTFEQIAGGLNVHPPADGNTAPPGPYMLFLVDTNGVPSIAAMTRMAVAVADNQAPSAPGTLQATPGTNSVALSWIASSDNIGVTAYNVHRATTTGFTPSAANKIGQSGTTTYNDPSLAPGTYYYLVTAQDARGNVSAPSNQATATIVAQGVPDLTIAKSHTGSFVQGQTGATYTLTATNSGTSATAGTVTVSDTLPASLTPTAFAGSGWSCTLAPLSCTRSNALGAGLSYPAITLTVNVSASAPASVTNTATVGGGGETATSNDTANDPTSITGAASASITLVQHASNDAGTTAAAALAFPADNALHDWIAVAIRAGSHTGHVLTVTDTRGNQYQRAFQREETTDSVSLALFYAENVGSGPNTVTVTDSTSAGTLRLAILEYSGVATSASLDGTPAVAEANSSSAASPLVSANASDLILGVFSASDAATVTAGAGFVLEERVPAAPNTKLAVEDKKQVAFGSASATATLNPGQPWAAAVAAFRAAAAGPSPVPPKLNVTSPTEGATNYGSAINVTYTATGDLTEVNHVHFQVDSDPVVMDLSLDGVFTYPGAHVGARTLNGWLVRVDHSKITGTDATPVHFTVAVDPNDVMPPSVSVTAPTGGTTVSGIVNVTANASDNLGVYGVQFKLDGVNLGAEDLVAPYSMTWNSVSSVNGSHTLTAIARDVAGNETTATTVTVTSSNVSSNDPSVIGQWVGPYSWPLVSIHAVLLPSGKVLLIDDHSTATGVQVWDPVSNTLVSHPYDSANLFCAGHTLLADGRAFVIGGHNGAYVGIPAATIFDPTSETWLAASPMAYSRWYPTATSLPNGNVIATSGAINCPTCLDPAGSRNGVALIPEIYNAKTGAWSQLNNASLYLPLYPHMFVLPDGRLFAAASHEDAIVSMALDLNTQTWSVVDPVSRAGGSSVMYRPGKILKTGTGRNPDYSTVSSVATAFVIDMNLASPTWRAVASMNFARTQHNLTMLPDGTVFAAGGSTNSNVEDSASTVKTAELWSPVTETWRPLATMQEPRHYHSIGLLLPDGRVLMAGGGRFGPNYPTAEIYSPPYLFKGARPTITSTPTLIQYNTHFTVTTPDGARIAKVTLLRLGAVTHAFDENQRYIELSFTQVAGGLDVTGPVTTNPVLPGHYMMFLVDTNGIPSVSSIVRFPAP